MPSVLCYVGVMALAMAHSGSLIYYIGAAATSGIVDVSTVDRRTS